MTQTPLHNDMIMTIISFISLDARSQYKYNEFNPFKQNGMYGIIEFITLLINNVFHYIIYFFILDEKNAKIGEIIFRCCVILQTLFILYWFGNAYIHRGK